MSELAGVIRALLAFAGGYIVAQGFVSEADWTAISGAVLTLIPIAWTIWQKRSQKTEVTKAVAAAVANQSSGV